MIDRFLLPLQHRLCAPVARHLAARRIGADSVTLAGFAIGVLGCLALAAGHFGAALLLILANRAADGVDGALARLSGSTARGAFLDIAADFLFYALVPLGFALADPAANALPAAVLVTAFVGTGSSFLAFAAVAARQGDALPAAPTKGIRYLGGLTEGAETIAFFVAFCLWPGAFGPLALLFACLCAVTTATRWRAAWLILGKGSSKEKT